MAEYDPRWGDSIASIESGGSKEPYSLMGPVTAKGDQAHGKYQVMGANIPEWTEAALGRRLTPQEFLADPAAQDAVFQHRFTGSVNRHGTPQDAASEWFTGRPINAQSQGSRDILGTSGSDYVSKFNRGMNAPDGATAIQRAMNPSTGSRMGYAPEENTAGALSQQPDPGMLSGRATNNGWLDNLGSTMINMAPGLASISDPDRARALQAVAAAQQKTAAATGSWSMGAVDPKSGKGVMTNSLTGQQVIKQIHSPQPDKPEKDFASQGYETVTGEGFAKQNQKIAADAVASHAAIGNLDTLRSALTNPDVYQGASGESVAYLKKLGNSIGLTDFKGVADADVAASLINKLTQESRMLNGGMPGSLSDKDLSFLKAANAGLDKTPEANQRIIDIYEKLHKRNIEMNAERVKYTNGGKQQLDEGFNTHIATKWAAEKAAADKADAAAPAIVAPKAPSTKMNKTPNGVSWSIN